MQHSGQFTQTGCSALQQMPESLGADAVTHGDAPVVQWAMAICRDLLLPNGWWG